MKFNVFILVALIFISIAPTFGQMTIEKYRSSENPDYWKNRKPDASYWQQDVHYKIKASIDAQTDILSGTEELTYFNNSPDTLYVVYFHLYQNAFRPNSDLAKLYEKGGRKAEYGHYEKEGKNIEILKISSSNVLLQTSVNGTIQKVWLNKPLLPNQSATFLIEFKTYFDREASWRRMSCYVHNGQIHYNGAHWYPRISVYDRKFGWTADQHLGHEFYGDFGLFEVELDFPDNFIVGATGFLENRNEVLPTDFLNKIRISNSSGKIESNGMDGKGRKNWKYTACNVHDFAFIADPSFRLDLFEITLPSGKVVENWAYVMAENAPLWKDAAYISAKIIEHYSKLFGEYAYNSMIVADARSGMEYPMLTMNSGNSPDYAYIFAHEIGHNWFFGALGSNETYRAFMDEGFTQFLTVHGLEELQKSMPISSKQVKKCLCSDYQPLPVRYTAVFQRYLSNAQKEGGQQLNTHSDNFNTGDTYGNAYRQTYYKGAVMLYNLQYVLGDSLFYAAMQNYFNQWKFCHPYPEDFRNSIIHFTKVDLNWFFDQWLETKKTIDYSVVRVKRKMGTNDYSIRFKRKGEMQMPVDFTVITVDSQSFSYHIPNREFVKNTTSIVLPQWFGWDLINKTYDAKISLPERIKTVIIDTSLRLADVNMLNNYKPFDVNLRYDNGMILDEDWQHYVVDARPGIALNCYDGLKLGLHVDGNYLNFKHIFEALVLFNTTIARRDETPVKMRTRNVVNWRFNYETPISKYSLKTKIKLGIKNLDGLEEYKMSLVHTVGNHSFSLQAKSMYRRDSVDFYNLIYENEWSRSTKTLYNNLLDINYLYKNKFGQFKLGFRTSAFISSFNFLSATAEIVQNFPLKKLNLRTRIFSQISGGKSMPLESQLYFSGANPEEMMDNKFYRSAAMFPHSDFRAQTGTFNLGGGLNLRAYNNYLSISDTLENQKFIYRGHSGASISCELEFGKYLPVISTKLSKYFTFNPYFFVDAGSISISDIDKKMELSKVRADAGFGFTFGIKSFGKYDKYRPLIFRLDFPLYLSNIPASQTENYMFRWVLGVNKSF